MSSIAFACFDCRIAMKRDQNVEELICPRCDGKMYSMGWSFHAPKQKDVEQWKKVQWLFAEGFRFFGSGWGKGIPLPERLKDVEKFLKDNPTHGLRTAKRIPEIIP